MAAAPAKSVHAAFDLKSANLPLVALALKSADLATISAELTARFGKTPDYFDHDAVVLDLTAVAEDNAEIDFGALLPLLRSFRMSPVAVRAGSEAQMAAARTAGLVDAREAVPVAPRMQPERKPIPAPAPPADVPTLVIDRPLRSGQQVYARGGDLIVNEMVSFGAEVIADGNIHVYAPLRGRVIAGAHGDKSARIYTTCLEPELLSIAGVYRTTDVPLPEDVLGKPAIIRLENDMLVMTPIQL